VIYPQKLNHPVTTSQAEFKGRDKDILRFDVPVSLRCGDIAVQRSIAWEMSIY
jgi:hypothetical protein